MRHIARALSAWLFVLAVSAAQACSSSTAEPAPSPSPQSAFEPEPAVVVEKAKIAVGTTWEKGYFDGMEKQINDALGAAGLNAEFEIQYKTHQSDVDSDDVFFNEVKAELTAGHPSADAYLLDFIKSGALFDAGLTMDVTDAVMQRAPVFYSKYGGLFRKRLTGIPTGIFNSPRWSKAVLMLRQDFASAGSGIRTIEDVFRFIDDTIVEPKAKYTVLAYEMELADQWALGKGYYSLGNFGVDGLLYCGMNDAAFKPIPLEEIPGFGEFLTRMKEYRRNGAIRYPYDSAEATDCIAYISDLSSYYYPSQYQCVPTAEGAFTARLLSPDKPGYFIDPIYVNELAVPKACGADKAGEISRFIEWLYAGQDNFDQIIYGKKGADFLDEGGRYTPLVGGKPLQGQGFEQFRNLFFGWPAAAGLSNSDYFRLPAAVPEGVEALAEDGIRQNLRFPLAGYVAVNNTTFDQLLKTGDDMQAVCKQRDDAVNRLIQGDPAVFTEESLAAAMEEIRQFKSGWLCEQYAAIIQKIVQSR